MPVVTKDGVKACQRLVNVLKSALIELGLILPSIVVSKFVSGRSVEAECRIRVNDSRAGYIGTEHYLTTLSPV